MSWTHRAGAYPFLILNVRPTQPAMLGLTYVAACSPVGIMTASHSAMLSASQSFLEVMDRGCDVALPRWIWPRVQKSLAAANALQLKPSWKAAVLPGDQGHQYIPHIACHRVTPSIGMSDIWAVIYYSHCSAVLKEDHKAITLQERMKWPRYILYATCRNSRRTN